MQSNDGLLGNTQPTSASQAGTAPCSSATEQAAPLRVVRADGAGAGGAPSIPPGGSHSARSILSLIEAHRAEMIRLERRPNTLKDHCCGYDALLGMGDTVDAIGQDNFCALKERWVAEDRSASYMNRRIAGMKMVTHWAAKWGIGLLAEDPLTRLAKIEMPRVKKDKRTFSLEEARAILKASEGTDWHLPFILYFSTGIRKTALMLCEGRDFDSDSHILTVRVGEGNKVNHQDELPVGVKAAERIVARSDQAATDPLFPSLTGGFRSPREPHRALQRACDKAGVLRGGCHAMRRCCATEVARMHGSSVASLVLGHADGGKRTLAETHYIQATAEDAREAVEELEAMLLHERK